MAYSIPLFLASWDLSLSDQIWGFQCLSVSHQKFLISFVSLFRRLFVMPQHAFHRVVYLVALSQICAKFMECSSTFFALEFQGRNERLYFISFVLYQLIRVCNKTREAKANNKRFFPFWALRTKGSPLSRFNDWPFPTVVIVARTRDAIKAARLAFWTKKGGQYIGYWTYSALFSLSTDPYTK